MFAQFPKLLPNIEKVKEELLCPISLEPLTDAYALVPCMHKVQKAAAEKIFGSTNGGWLCTSDVPCPVCYVTVIGYLKDHSTRNIAEHFVLIEKDIQEMASTVKKKVKRKAVQNDEQVSVRVLRKSSRLVPRKSSVADAGYFGLV